MIDLHMHSYFSDGIYSPEDLIKKAKKAGFNFISLTDHNGIDGVKEFLNKGERAGLKVISGVEIYTHYPARHRYAQASAGEQKQNLHLLGYGFDLENKELNSALKELQAQRIPRIKQAIKLLQADNWQITEKEIFSFPSVYLGLFQLASVLQKHPQNWERIKKDFNWFKGKIIPITEIIVKYFIKDSHSIYGGKSICPETRILVDQAIKLIKQAGGKTVLAHPGEHLSWKHDVLIAELKKIGLDGLEAVSAHHSWQEIEHWQKLARELDLIITPGSDFHGDLPHEWGFPIQSQWEYFTPNIVVEI